MSQPNERANETSLQGDERQTLPAKDESPAGFTKLFLPVQIKCRRGWQRIVQIDKALGILERIRWWKEGILSALVLRVAHAWTEIVESSPSEQAIIMLSAALLLVCLWLVWLRFGETWGRRVMYGLCSMGLASFLYFAFDLGTYEPPVLPQIARAPSPPLPPPNLPRRSLPETVVRQESTGKNSPNIVTRGSNSPVTTGANSPITINPDVNPNRPVTTYDCVGNSRIISPGTIGGLFGDNKPFNDMIALLNSRDYPALLSQCERELEMKPEWLTPYLFCSSAHVGLGNIDDAKKMFAHFESKAGPEYDQQDCLQLVKYLRRTLSN